MKKTRLTCLITLVLLCSHSAYAQEIKTKVIQRISIDRGAKVFEVGDSVTVFAYKKKSDIHYLGIYSDDYAEIINMRTIPVDLSPKQLKKMPNAQDDKSKEYLESVKKDISERIRNKALSCKIKDLGNGTFFGENGGKSCTLKNEIVTIVGYKNDGVGSLYAIIKSDGAGVYKHYGKDSFKSIPLAYMPSTDDPMVRLLIDKENKKIEEQKKVREEEERRLAAIKKAHDDSIKAIKDSIEMVEKQQELAELKAKLAEQMDRIRKLGPALIKVTGWTMDSAGGITVSLQITNCTNQRIKYVTFKGYFLNAVGDRCRNEISGSTEWKGRGVGPIEAYPKTPDELVDGGKEHIGYYDFEHSSFYTRTADTFHLSSVTIEYMNGKKTVLAGAELKKRVIYE